MTEPREDIAIIGIGCRFPGSANSPDEFWRLLRDGVDAIGDIPPERANLMHVYDPDPAAPGRSYLRRGGFMDDIDRWDAGFFGISPREAAHIDPQHRLLLEVAWEALEDAGQSIDRLAGSRTGVFVGISTHDYGDTQCDPANRHLLDSHSNSGSATSIAANRISYLYDLRGPSFTVDTACSSSLTAVHLACRSMLAEECDLAIVGGVQMQINPELTIGFCKASMISPSGECRAFDASANGYVRSEGTGVVVLKRLSAALADGDEVYAVIVGSAINQDGRTNGMTVPSPVAQEALIREALASARLSAVDVHYVEAHGTGTPVGDPLETQALGAVLREGREAGEYCAIGSVKTNIGHLEAASGIAGLIKTALCVHHREIPRSLHFTVPNPDIDFEGGRLRVVTTHEPWPAAAGARATAGVNSFGFGGANAHVIVREAPPRSIRASGDDAPLPTLLPLSARSREALLDVARQYQRVLSPGSLFGLGAVASAAAHLRTHHDHRVAVVAASADDAIEALDAFIAGESRAVIAAGRRSEQGGKLAFVFSGMGPQWWGMGRQLRAEHRVFREMIERCDAALRPHAPWGLIDELSRDEATSRIFEPDLAQVTNFAIQVALADVWKSWGITPDAVVGHSAGEMAAAYVSGALSLEDAVLVSYHRSRLQGEAHPGKILAVGLSAEQLHGILGEYDGEVDLAAVNSPVSCTVAGGAAAIEALLARLQRDQVFARMLSFAVPYHSARMDPIREALTAAVSSVRPRAASIPIISTVSGTWAEGAEFGASYWFENVRRTVRFADAITTLEASGHATFLELSPHPVLGASVGECLASRKPKVAIVGSLRRKEDERGSLLRTLGTLYAQGRSIDWTGVFEGRHAPVRLPSYPWQRERHWFEGASAGADAEAHLPSSNGSGDHPLLGRRVRAPHALWESSLGGDRIAYLDDHRIQGTTVFPGAAYIEMALNAVRGAQPAGADSPVILRDIAFKRALFLTDRSRTVVQLAFDADAARFEVHSSNGAASAAWTLHASGAIEATSGDEPTVVNLGEVRARCADEVSHEDCYAALARRGLEYGPAFRGIQELWTGAGEAIGRIHVPGLGTAGSELHPALLDAAFQLLISAAGGTLSSADTSVYLPVLLRRMTLHAAAGSSFWAHARRTSSDENAIEGDVDLIDETGRIVARAVGFRCQRIEDARRAESIDEWLYEYQWSAQALAGTDRRSVIAATTAEIVGGVQPAADVLASESRWSAYYDRVEPRLNDIAVAFMRAATASIRESGASVAPARRMLADHIESVLASAASSARASAEEQARALASDCPEYETDIALLVRCGTHLADVLTGRTDAGQVLFGADASDLVSRFYRDAPPSRYYNTLAASAIAMAASHRSTDDPDRILRILEVGGGTGGTTDFVLPLLDPARTGYVFTDVTPLFTEQARGKFAGRGLVTTRTLDIERDVVGQGFAPHSFDVILAANVLHATRSLADTLANVKHLLAPGGMLVLIEITRRPVWTDVIFGLTDGWWRFADRDVRPSHALLPASQWTSLLVREGFEDVATVADSVHEGEAAQTVLLARAASSSDRVRTPVSPDGRWLVLADRGGIGHGVAERLRAAGAASVMVHEGEAFSALLERLDADGVRPTTIVHCRGLDAPAIDTIAVDDLLESQRVGLESTMQLVQALAALGGQLPALCVVTSGAQAVSGDAMPVNLTQAPLWGFARVITKEQPGLRTRLIDIGADRSDEDVIALVSELASGEWEDEVALRGGVRQVRRLHRVSASELATRESRRAAQPDEGYRVEVDTAGALETLTLRHTERRRPERDEVEIAVGAAGLNFRDVMLAMGLYPSIAGEASFGRGLLGLDCAGVVTACGADVTGLSPGDDVIAIASGAFASYVITPAAVVARRPSMLSVTQGAAVPSVFVTAFYALRHLARLQRGERVLIHSATGGVGLAAIQVARECGAEIFATAGSAEKRSLLASMGVEHVMDSRTLSFADAVMERTGGEGVDVVLNSLPGEALLRGIGLLRGYGRFVEIGKRDIFQDSRIGLLAFRKNLSFFGVDVDRLSLDRPQVAREMLQEVVSRFEQGTYTALPEHVFPASRVEDAMRLMAQARHVGKVVLSMDDPDVRVASSGSGPLFRADSTYVITGGLGGFGLAVAEWMSGEGAGHLVLVGRSGASPETEEALRSLRASGVTVEVRRADVSRGDDVRRLLEDVRATMPPVRGVVHAAMVLDDAPIVELDRERLDRVMAPKMAGAWHLHRETMGDALDVFVLFSSLTSMFGNPLQANYAAANAFLDALSHHRRALGRPALAVNWGPLASVGYVSRHRDVADYLERQGYLSMGPTEAFAVLGTLIRRGSTQMMAARIDWSRWAESAPTAAASPMLRHFAPRAGARPSTSGGSARDGLLSLPDAARREGVEQFLREKVGKVLGLSPSRLDAERALTELGFDSLIAVELMTVLSVELGVELAAVKLLQGVSIAGLVEMVMDQLGPGRVGAPAEGTEGRGEVVEDGAAVISPVAASVVGGPPHNKAGSPPADVRHENGAARGDPLLTTHATAPALRDTLATPIDPPAASRYASLDYARWTTGQRAVRGAVSVAVRALTRTRVEGLHNMPLTGGCLLAINHLSMADMPVVLSVLPRRTIMFASEHLRDSAFMHWLLSDMGDAIYVRRGEGDTNALARGLDVLRAGGLLGIGPEGTRSPSGLSRGRTGIAYLATQAGVPVVPLAAWGQERIPHHLRALRRAPITVRIGTPLSFTDRTPDAARLRTYTDEVMLAIAALLPDEYRGVYGREWSDARPSSLNDQQ